MRRSAPLKQNPDRPLKRDRAYWMARARVAEDVLKRLIVFDGGAELMPWVNAHRLHGDEPYIGCPFCHDRFEVKP